VAFDHIAIPLVANEHLLGSVVLQVADYKEFIEEEIRFVGALANQAALAIDKASLYGLERETTERLRELEKARADFVAVVTHDLRTPLSVIRGYLDLLADKNGKTTIPVGEATAQVELLDHLVDRILAGVRTDRPELHLRRTRFDLRATVLAALKAVAPMARRHKLVAPRGGQAIFVLGDRRRTSEVVAGLVHNATKYAPAGTKIAVRLERESDRAVVRVQDEGAGVPPNERARIFEPYARGAAHDDVPGAGIGLFASRRVVEAQGGDIWVEDAPEGGAIFAFSVPLARARMATRG
jgi:K+-sensing histidine kinase KdpD